MKISVRPWRSFRSSSRLRTCACTLTSRAETGSSQMIRLGFRTSDRAIEMRWHWPPENWCAWLSAARVGSMPTSSSVWSTTGGALLPRAPLPDVERLHHDVAHLAARVERGDRVLEDHLHPRAGFAHHVPVHRGQLVALEAHRARCRPGELHDRPAGGALAAPRLADEAERLARADVEADAGHGVDDESGAPDRKLDDEVLDPQQHVVAVAADGPCRSRPLATTSSRLTVTSSSGRDPCAARGTRASRPGTSRRRGGRACRPARAVAAPRGSGPWRTRTGGRTGSPAAG